MSRSRSRRYYEDFDDDEYFEQFKSRRQSKLKKTYDREMIGYDPDEESAKYNQE